MVNIFGYISESKYMVPSTGKNKTRLRLDQLGLSLLRGLHVCFVSFEGLTHAKQGKVADWKHQTPIQPKHEATSRSSCRRCLSSASSACSTCPHLQSQAITDQWWIAPLGHRIRLKNPKTMHSLAPKNWFQNDIEIQIRHVSPPSMHSQLLHLFTWSRQSYCYHQFKVRMYGIKLSSPAHSFTHASMLPLPAPRLGKIHDACPTLGRPAGIFGHSSHCKAFNVCDDMQFCCLVTPVPSKARCQSRCESTVSTAVAITRSHASRETTPSAASLFVCVHCRRISQRRVRKIYASSGWSVPVAPAGTTRTCNPNVLANDLTVEWRWQAAQSKRSVKGFSGQ